MNEKQFQALMGSVREAGKILRGTGKPPRAFRFPEPNVQEDNPRNGESRALSDLSGGTILGRHDAGHDGSESLAILFWNMHLAYTRPA
ncbi:hypothetical protein C4900_14055 [Acidiferrobacter thiooxydans]|jgi:hypothetical protein|uniref:Uncharacterized protein n=1 Tax=Acidiferrobacter thiooxydans TaxID=163359 RepID=A0A1C2G163_9GAMM|nr:hypothetical protein C4900_14055 [Acidiferrobacter thiooxydans]